jgi:hypothetical protein
VVVLATLGAPPRAGLLRRRRRATEAAPEPPPEPVTTSRATVVVPEPLEAPDGWLAAADHDALAADAIDVLNRLLHHHAVASADPSVRPASRAQALVVRVGVGEGEQVADGRWRTALALPPPAEPKRALALRPQERLAALLGGRDVALACEVLVLRARQDLDGGRPREAALQADLAVRTALAELEAWRGHGDLGARADELRELAGPLAAAAARALEAGPAEGDAEAVERAVARLEAALRARSATGF